MKKGNAGLFEYYVLLFENYLTGLNYRDGTVCERVSHVRRFIAFAR